MDFSKELYNIMQEEELTVSKVAKKSGVSKSSICRYLNRTSLPRIDVAYHILSSIGYTIEVKGRR